MIRIDELAVETPRNVEQHASAGEAILQGHDRVGARAGALHLTRRPAIVHLAALKDVTEGVEVARGHAMIGDADVIGGNLQARDLGNTGIISGDDHVMLRRPGVFRTRPGREVARQADGAALLHQPRRRQRFDGGQMVQRPALVILAPPPPVGDGGEQIFHVLGGEGGGSVHQP